MQTPSQRLASHDSAPFDGAFLTASAILAVATPTLIAFNLAPSATFFNQAAAFVGWGCFLGLLSFALPRQSWPRTGGSLALLGAMGIVFLAALGASLFASAPWSLSLSNAGTIASAIVAIAVGAMVQRGGLGRHAFHAFCIALVVAGVASSLIGLVQVFAPTLPDGDWVAISAIPGRATGNLRQPNHLSSLLLWSIVAAVWLGEARAAFRWAAAALVVVFIYVVVLSASRTGAVGMLTLAAWGIFDRRLSKQARVLLVLSPLLYGACWWGTTVWANASHHLFGGQTRFGGSGDISSSRFGIWSNTLSLIAMHPWFGVGFGEFNFAWTLTPFPHRPVAFFDHTHNLFLNFLVELGIPLALVVCGLMVFAMWRALKNAIAEGRPIVPQMPALVPVQRAAFVIVVMVAVHSMLEYPLWYAYYLLPTAFAFGLCLERAEPGERPLAFVPDALLSQPMVLASIALVVGATLATWDYVRVVVIFSPPPGAASLDERIDKGRKSILFAHHADYAAATVTDHPGTVMSAFARAPHYLLDARLMEAWAKALDENGETDKASYVAARLREFRNEQAADFFAPCAEKIATGVAPAASAVPAPVPRPFQCRAPTGALRYEDFEAR